jgi:hypothetical protein
MLDLAILGQYVNNPDSFGPRLSLHLPMRHLAQNWTANIEKNCKFRSPDRM